MSDRSSKKTYHRLSSDRRFFAVRGTGRRVPLPSVRELSDQLGVNHNTIQKAYKELDYQGLTAAVPGRGSFLREDAFDRLTDYLNENVLPDFKNMLRGMLHAGATKEQALDYVRQLLDEIDEA